ncbi:N-formylglutamate amidohydrolase [Microvirga tunisiensis]|uniref:N-formylglutamate amidohydrolase n=1 Tax=Pannonibacter tanglangensis TaxID=2750084 RepID=A0A7X5J9M8_9HYPH|nr:N-formylglutamate amidohydrolase [Pannonibacter sp. XCT-53]NBN79122.1 N-formylglutamate amidohydrolase [Pannonibacter sp. XCT-53]
MAQPERPFASDGTAVSVENRNGSSDYVLVCDHASNFIPEAYGDLGLSAEARVAHIAWDPGALGTAQEMARLLDAPLVYPRISRLIIDCNRDHAAHDLIPAISETTRIPGNENLGEEERKQRIALAHAPFHSAIETLVAERARAGKRSVIVSVHTYTPVYKGVARPWEIGIIADKDRRLGDAMIAALKAPGDLTVGDNEPYSPADGVYYTLTRHGEAHGRACAMIEIRNSDVATPEAEKQWGQRLGKILADSLPVLEEGA